jgi:NAD+ synthase (glutamine-hydrolysing)
LEKYPKLRNTPHTREKVANCAYEILNGRIVRRYVKRDLPNYGVFDDKRVFVSGLELDEDFVLEGAQSNIALAICEDIWGDIDLETRNISEETEYLVVLNASPFRTGIEECRRRAVERIEQKYHIEVVYVNASGAQDELVFDGAGFTGSNVEKKYAACVVGLKDYCLKNGFDTAVLGLSGGIDSALVAKMAVTALGAKNVTGILMPSRYSSRGSVVDALELADNLKMRTLTCGIEPMFDEYLRTLKASGIESTAVSEQNVQARIRGNILMFHSNTNGSLVLATGNKSEIAVGYSTIYGDAVGGYAPLKDVFKTEVFKMAALFDDIPQNIQLKPPSAELAPGQKDSDSLPDYCDLDSIIEYLLGISDKPLTDVQNSQLESVKAMVKRAEWKRQQYPPGPKVSRVSFGKDWRIPLTFDL